MEQIRMAFTELSKVQIQFKDGSYRNIFPVKFSLQTNEDGKILEDVDGKALWQYELENGEIVKGDNVVAVALRESKEFGQYRRTKRGLQTFQKWYESDFAKIAPKSASDFVEENVKTLKKELEELEKKGFKTE